MEVEEAERRLDRLPAVEEVEEVLVLDHLVIQDLVIQEEHRLEFLLVMAVRPELSCLWLWNFIFVI